MFSKKKLDPENRCARNPYTFFKYTASFSTGVVVGDLIGGYVLDACFSPKPSNIAFGICVASVAGLYFMDLESKECKNRENKNKLR